MYLNMDGILRQPGFNLITLHDITTSDSKATLLLGLKRINIYRQKLGKSTLTALNKQVQVGTYTRQGTPNA